MVAHTLSPIDLIPDFIPVLGVLDDLIITPLGIALALKMIPEDLLAECQQRAESIAREDEPASWAAAVIVLIWLLGASLVVTIALRIVRE